MRRRRRIRTDAEREVDKCLHGARLVAFIAGVGTRDSTIDELREIVTHPDLDQHGRTHLRAALARYDAARPAEVQVA